MPGFDEFEARSIESDNSKANKEPMCRNETFSKIIACYQISYESSNELLSNKRLYPSFFRTIPTDRYQVRAMLQLLSEFQWTWIALLGSDDDYGTQGMQSLSELALKYGICVAYQAIISSYSEDTRTEMLQMIKGIVQTNVNVVVVFSRNRKASGFFSLVVEQNVTDKVWIGSENWSISTLVSRLPKIKSIGSVMGISVKAAEMPGFAEFEARSIESENSKANEEPVCQSETFSEILACYQLLQQIKQVNISIHDAPLYFDNNGDPPTGYDIIAWDWVGDSVSYKVIGSYSPNPERLLINRDLINWNAKDNNTVPTSVCSAECWKGYRRVLTGTHVCCFSCEACPAGTYVDINDLFNCKPCEIHQWSLPESDACLNRTVEYLPWNDITSAVLIITSVMTLLLTVATAGLFLLNLNTPVVKSAGGKTCLLMLSSLACASCSVYGHFGVPTAVGCAFLRELFCFSFTICLSCVAVRSFQIVCIFKMSGKLPKAYEFWTKNNGPHVFILVSSAVGFLISLLRIVLDRPIPIENSNISPDKIVLECSGTQSVGSAMETGAVVDEMSCHLFQVMRLAVTEINSSGRLLPNVTLGYHVLDCTSEAICLKAMLYFVSTKKGLQVNSQSFLYNDQTNVKAVIGPMFSSIALSLGAILSPFLMPQVSYGATNEKLSNKWSYPSFFRTIPSDNNQVRAMLMLLAKFQWNWIALLTSEEDYGEDGGQSLLELASQYGVCVAYKGKLPTGSSNSTTRINEMIQNIIRSRVNVTVLFSLFAPAVTFFQMAAKETKLKDKVWIASEPLTYKAFPEQNAGKLIILPVMQPKLPEELESEFNRRENAKTDTQNETKAMHGCEECDSVIDKGVDGQYEFSVYSAVHAVAHALHQLLGCDSGKCRKDAFHPKDLLVELQKVNFSLLNHSVYFDKNGNHLSGYDIVVWDWNAGKLSSTQTGFYSPASETFEVDGSLINWTNNKVPTSVCSEECQTGHRRKWAVSHRCCFTCEVCPEETFLNTSDLYVCQPCPNGHWSSKGSALCQPRTLVYLFWTDSVSIILQVVSLLFLVMVSGTAAVFVTNLKTPVVRSAGGKISLLMLASLASSCCGVFSNVGKPTVATCQLAIVFALGFTTCLSCITVRSFQLLCIFKLAAKLPNAFDFWVKEQGQYILIFLCTTPQIAISIYLLIRGLPPVEIINKDTIMPICSISGLVLNLSYIGLLSLFSFVCSHMGKKLPDNYNEAKCTAFSLFICITSWISYFTLISVYTGNPAAFNAAAMLITLFAIFGSYFIPKCHTILIRPELNTTTHFQSCIQLYTMQNNTKSKLN
ncbi:UNVERIFIED_CONTAM: hypothetical protein FKN15_069454 [Acipenser sinensis]